MNPAIFKAYYAFLISRFRGFNEPFIGKGSWQRRSLRTVGNQKEHSFSVTHKLAREELESQGCADL